MARKKKKVLTLYDAEGNEINPMIFFNEQLRGEKKKLCKNCGEVFEYDSYKKQYCPKCAREKNLQSKRDWYWRNKDKYKTERGKRIRDLDKRDPKPALKIEDMEIGDFSNYLTEEEKERNKKHKYTLEGE